jgi:hypothetical protein
MAGFVPATHTHNCITEWVAGRSPAMTMKGWEVCCYLMPDTSVTWRVLPSVVIVQLSPTL